LPQDEEILTKVRYKDSGMMSRAVVNEVGEIEVDFYDDVQGIAPGQSAVFYEGNDLLGGGFIAR
jgi:tRNA-specific 2-thiouridylase